MMFSFMIGYRKSFAVILFVGMFSCATCHAERGGSYGGGSYGGERYNNDDNFNNRNDDLRNNDYNREWDDSAVVVGDPGSSSTSCTTTQQCDAYGNCTQNQVCN